MDGKVIVYQMDQISEIVGLHSITEWHQVIQNFNQSITKILLDQSDLLLRE